MALAFQKLAQSKLLARVSLTPPLRPRVFSDSSSFAYFLFFLSLSPQGTSSTLFSTFDIVAVTPTTDKLFAQCCERLEVDIIALDLAQRLPFHIRTPQVGQALERGLVFEVSYSAAIADATARRNLLANAQALVTAARGRNILFTSGAERALLARGPYDVANLARLAGLDAAVRLGCPPRRWWRFFLFYY